MTRQYEIVYIFDSALEEAEINEKLERFHSQLKSPAATDPITALAHWGKRTLAFPIKKKEVGHYVVAQCETEPNLLAELERVVKLDDQVLRHLVVVNDGLAVEPAAVTAGKPETDDDDREDDE